MTEPQKAPFTPFLGQAPEAAEQKTQQLAAFEGLIASVAPKGDDGSIKGAIQGVFEQNQELVQTISQLEPGTFTAFTAKTTELFTALNGQENITSDMYREAVLSAYNEVLKQSIDSNLSQDVHADLEIARYETAYLSAFVGGKTPNPVLYFGFSTYLAQQLAKEDPAEREFLDYSGYVQKYGRGKAAYLADAAPVAHEAPAAAEEVAPPKPKEDVDATEEETTSATPPPAPTPTPKRYESEAHSYIQSKYPNNILALSREGAIIYPKRSNATIPLGELLDQYGEPVTNAIDQWKVATDQAARAKIIENGSIIDAIGEIGTFGGGLQGTLQGIMFVIEFISKKWLGGALGGIAGFLGMGGAAAAVEAFKSGKDILDHYKLKASSRERLEGIHMYHLSVFAQQSAEDNPDYSAIEADAPDTLAFLKELSGSNSTFKNFLADLRKSTDDEYIDEGYKENESLTLANFFTEHTSGGKVDWTTA